MKNHKLSKFLCFILRHKPEAANIIIDDQGWTDTKILIENLSKESPFTLEDLLNIHDSDNKCRYSFNDDKSKFRANQGHSLEYVDIKFKKYIPDNDLYHGTSKDNLEAILREGLTPQTRLYVHLSNDLETAKKVGKRHSKKEDPIILVIDKKADIEFYITDNNVVNTKHVPAKFIRVFD